MTGDTQKTEILKRDNLLIGEGGGARGWGGAKSCDRKKAWFSINHSILSRFETQPCTVHTANTQYALQVYTAKEYLMWI